LQTYGDVQSEAGATNIVCRMQPNPKTDKPIDLTLAVHVTPGDTYEWSQVLLARASFRGTLEFLTAAWERALGYGRQEISGKSLSKLLRSGRPAAVVAAILDERNPDPVDLTLRCRSGAAKRFRLHRRVDDYLREVFIVAEERKSSLVLDPPPAGDGEFAQASRPPMRFTR
jgi:hypothetical protein